MKKKANFKTLITKNNTATKAQKQMMIDDRQIDDNRDREKDR